VTLDVPTLLVVTVFIATMAGGLMLVTWLQNRSEAALLGWGAAYLCGAVGAALFGARGQVPDFWSINIANAFMIAAAGLAWAGVRMFDRRPVALWYGLVGSAVWLAAFGVGEFYQSLPARAVLGSTISATYAGLAAWELWRGRRDGLLARRLATCMFAFQCMVFVSRIPMTLLAGIPPGGVMHLTWLPYGIFEALLYTFSSAFLLLTMTKERAEAQHKRAAVIDPLTGVPNRRGFMDRAEGVLARCREEGQPVSVLLFDLDHFKQINDTYGHQAGDDVLVEFCRAAQKRIGPDDVFARLGGEEFVCMLPGMKLQLACHVAERIRRDFDAERWIVGVSALHATVSIGVSNSVDAGGELAALLGAADKALYQAKAKGRNRVEGRRPQLVLVGSDDLGPTPRGAA
jgi:diguanylate cyclase (GGDEF)-like protein